MSFDLELTGQRALVTAGTKGIGAPVVEVPTISLRDRLWLIRKSGEPIRISTSWVLGTEFATGC